MKKITEVLYRIVKESDFDPKLIYAFNYRGKISVLSRKDDRYYWSCLDSTIHVWYKTYECLEDALEGVTQITDFTKHPSIIYEFDNQKEFFEWALSELSD